MMWQAKIVLYRKASTAHTSLIDYIFLNGVSIFLTMLVIMIALLIGWVA